MPEAEQIPDFSHWQRKSVSHRALNGRPRPILEVRPPGLPQGEEVGEGSRSGWSKWMGPSAGSTREDRSGRGWGRAAPPPEKTGLLFCGPGFRKGPNVQVGGFMDSFSTSRCGTQQ